jgi:hypothetical protein
MRSTRAIVLGVLAGTTLSVHGCGAREGGSAALAFRQSALEDAQTLALVCIQEESKADCNKCAVGALTKKDPNTIDELGEILGALVHDLCSFEGLCEVPEIFSTGTFRVECQCANGEMLNACVFEGCGEGLPQELCDSLCSNCGVGGVSAVSCTFDDQCGQ